MDNIKPDTVEHGLSRTTTEGTEGGFLEPVADTTGNTGSTFASAVESVMDVSPGLRFIGTLAGLESPAMRREKREWVISCSRGRRPSTKITRICVRCGTSLPYNLFTSSSTVLPSIRLRKGYRAASPRNTVNCRCPPRRGTNGRKASPTRIWSQRKPHSAMIYS